MKIPWRWRIHDAIVGLPDDIKTWWNCLQGRHQVKPGSYPKCCRCDRVPKK